MTAIDWSRPLEAYHEDGRVVPVVLMRGKQHPDQWGAYAVEPEVDGRVYFMATGEAQYGSLWRIRNAPSRQATWKGYQEATPQAPDLTARMEALVRRMKDRVMSPAGVPAEVIGDYMDARTIASMLPEPVDGDLILARQIVKDTLKPEDHRRCDCRDKIDAGEWDSGQKVRIALAALKHPRGRALEKGETA